MEESGRKRRDWFWCGALGSGALWRVSHTLQQRGAKQLLLLLPDAEAGGEPLSGELIIGIVFNFLQLREPICGDFI